MNVLSMEKLNKRHQAMLYFQDEISPFTPTIRELQDVWDLASTSSVRSVLQKLIEMECVKTRAKGNYTQYYAV